jgi:vacuolar protein sorting-associated protein 45
VNASRLASSWDQSTFQRIVTGIVSSLLVLKKRPHVRFDRSSTLASRIGQEVGIRIDRDASLFDFRQGPVPPVLLILDRREDPITPLLNQWTYQAMVHELLGKYGLQNNRLDLKDMENIRDEHKEIVLSPTQDDFFRINMFENFGDFATNVREAVMMLQAKTDDTSSIDTIDDMKRVLEKMPELQREGHFVSKHTFLVSELSRIVSTKGLMEVSQVEQELVSADNHSEAVRNIQKFLRDPKIGQKERLRLVLLYAIKYERDRGNRLPMFLDMLREGGSRVEDITSISMILKYAGESVRHGELFGRRGLVSYFQRKVTRSVRGVENVFTQHQPYVTGLVDQVAKTKLKESTHPYALGHPMKDAPTEIVIFIIGGATFEESTALHRYAEASGVSILLGGTVIHNMDSFLEEVRETVEDGPSGSGRRRLPQVGDLFTR